MKKVLQNVTKASLAFILLSFFMFYPPQQAEAKFWGRDTIHTPSTSADGKCWDYQCTTVYRFWINFGETCEYVLVDPDGPCSYQNISF